MQSVTVLWAVLGVYVVICETNCIVVYEAGNGYEIRIHKVELMLVIGREQ